MHLSARWNGQVRDRIHPNGVIPGPAGAVARVAAVFRPPGGDNPTMSMLERVKTVLQPVDTVPGRPAPAPGLGLSTDRVLVTEPRTGMVWRTDGPARVGWVLTAAADYPLTVTLVRINGVMAEDIAVLATGVDPSALAVTVTVPQTDPGADYAVSITSADPTSVYSPTFAIAAA